MEERKWLLVARRETNALGVLEEQSADRVGLSSNRRNVTAPTLSPSQPGVETHRAKDANILKSRRWVCDEDFFSWLLCLGLTTPPLLCSRTSHAPCGCWWHSGVYFRQCVRGLQQSGDVHDCCFLRWSIATEPLPLTRQDAPLCTFSRFMMGWL